MNQSQDSAASVMSRDYLALTPELKVSEAIQKIRQLAETGGLPHSYVYVVTPPGRLAGVLNMRDMLLARPEAELGSVMRREIFSVPATLDREQVARQLSERRFFAVPVVDGENRLLGVIRAEELLRGVQEEASEDIQKMFGAGGDETSFSPVLFSVRKRLPWLHINLLTAFLAAWAVSLFEGVIAKMTILAVFLPVVAGQGGNAGAQSLAVVMRGLVLGEIPRGAVGRLILKESWLGLINGVAIGLVTALVAWIWHGSPWLGGVIGLAMIVNMLIACLAGAAIPIGMKSLGLDPAQCSNIILTTVTDVMGILAFLGFAVLFQSRLL